MKRTFLLLLTVLLSFSLSAQNRIQNYIEKLKADSLYINSATAILVTDHNGNEVASWNPDMPLLTASTLKTITTGIALNTLGPDFKFNTTLAYSGEIRDGVLYGDLYIVGGADPTLASPDTLGSTPEELFAVWHQALLERGVNRINGHIVADDRYFKPEIVPSSWAWSVMGPYYGAGASGLSFYENGQTFKFIPGLNRGDAVILQESYPHLPGMNYTNQLETSSKESRNRVSYYASDIAKEGRFKGSIPAGNEPVEIRASNKFPHLSLAHHFQNYLDSEGIYSFAKILDAREEQLPHSELLDPLVTVESPPLSKIINVTNRISNNFYSETLFRMVGKVKTGCDSYDSSRVAFIRALEELDLSTYGYSQNDGSGLSRQNYLSPRFFCNYYKAMAGTPYFDYFFESFPVPGKGGTLLNVLKDRPVKEKSRVHAKSGSLSNVRCYAGYVERKNGQLLYFAILTNNFAVPTAQMQVGIEGFMEQLTKY